MGGWAGSVVKEESQSVWAADVNRGWGRAPEKGVMVVRMGTHGVYVCVCVINRLILTLILKG